jgi:hypothetical protein
MPSLDEIRANLQKVQATLAIVLPVSGQIVQIGTASIAAIQLIRKMLDGGPTKADGTPLTEEDYLRMLAAAFGVTHKVISEADKNISESEARLGERQASGQGDGSGG